MIIWLLTLSLHAFATNCSSPPQPPGGRIGPAWWSQYSSWCSACGGTPYQNSSGGGCNPGPNWGGGSSGSSGGNYGSGLDPSQQLMLNVMQQGLQQMFRQPTPEEQEAARQRALFEEQQRLAAEAERQRLIKEKNDKMDAEADSTLALLGSSTSVSDEELLKQNAPKPEKAMSCKERQDLIARLEGEGLKRLDINIGKTRKMIKQAEEGALQADKDAVALTGEIVAGEMASAMEDFVKNKKTIEAMKSQLKKLKGGQLANADVDKLQNWIDGGLTAGNGVVDAYERAKKGNEFKFSDPTNTQWKQQMLTSLSEFNAGFMADTGAWELAGEHLSKGLGPAGPVVFKTSVLGIKVAANRGAKMISQNDLNEQKYHLGNMMKTRAEMAQRVKNLKREQEKCRG